MTEEPKCAGDYFLKDTFGRTTEEIKTLTKELEGFTDKQIAHMCNNLNKQLFDKYDGKCYKKEAKIIRNKSDLLNAELCRRNGEKIGAFS